MKSPSRKEVAVQLAMVVAMDHFKTKTPPILGLIDQVSDNEVNVHVWHERRQYIIFIETLDTGRGDVVACVAMGGKGGLDADALHRLRREHPSLEAKFGPLPSAS